MTEINIPTTESLEYRTEVKQLLDILADLLTPTAKYFCAESISNASDALNRIQFEMLTDAMLSTRSRICDRIRRTATPKPSSLVTAASV